jgi:Ricin-type beta-trefoil lectin domain
MIKQKRRYHEKCVCSASQGSRSDLLLASCSLLFTFFGSSTSPVADLSSYEMVGNMIKQQRRKSVWLLLAAILLAGVTTVGISVPASASAPVFQESNWGKLYSNDSLVSYPKCLIAQGQNNRVLQDTCLNSSQNELWHFNPQGNGYYTIESGENSGTVPGPRTCLDVLAFNHDYYGNVTTGPCNGSTNQQWYVNWVSNDFFSLKPRHAIFDGPGYIDSNNHWSPRGKCLDVFAFAHYNDAPVVQWECNGAVNQLWSYHPIH